MAATPQPKTPEQIQVTEGPRTERNCRNRTNKRRECGRKNELLFQNGINFNDLPNWQKRGMGLYWADVKKEGFNPKTQEKTIVKRREIKIDYELPMRDDYDGFIAQFLTKNT